jgi:hypothetical protein
MNDEITAGVIAVCAAAFSIEAVLWLLAPFVFTAAPATSCPRPRWRVGRGQDADLSDAEAVAGEQVGNRPQASPSLRLFTMRPG